MEQVIKLLNEIRVGIQNLEDFVPTEHNCKQIIGSIQRLDVVINYLQHVHAESGENNGE